MTTDQIASEAWNKIRNYFAISTTPQEFDAAVSIIKAAIDKAYQQGKLDAIKTTEYAKGWDDHVAAVRAAQKSEQNS